MKKFFLVAAILILPSLSFAHGSLLNLTKAAIDESLEVFVDSKAKDISDSFSGVKAWRSKTKIKVRIYFDENNQSVVYSCEMKHFQDGTEKMMCIE